MKKVLVVEDEPFLSDALKIKLDSLNCQPTVVNNGDQVLGALERDVPDIIILDLLLPSKDGLTVLDEVKANEKFKSIPIIVLTNMQDSAIETDCIMRGANLYLVKSSTSLDKLATYIQEFVK